MTKRKYTVFGETAVAQECSNANCKWQGHWEEMDKALDDDGLCTVNVCPDCGNDEFYGLIEIPVAVRFKQMVSEGRHVYRSRNPDIKAHLAKRIEMVAQRNHGLKPYVPTHEEYKCRTCGRKQKAHPETSYCFHCDTDNWD